MNAKQIKYVLTLAREGSFSKAADVLNITQPSLSQYIKRIEKEAGQRLFNRTNGDVRATDAGRAYIEIGQKMLDLEHQLEERLSDLAAYKSGTITIGISAHRSVALMPLVVKMFKSRYPGITLKIIEKNRNELIESAEHAEFDLVVTTLPIDELVFTYETVFIEENVIATSKSVTIPNEIMNNRKFPVISVYALNGLPFAMLKEDHLMQRELSELIRMHGLDLKKEVECSSLEALVEMVKQGIGAAFIPACLAKDPSLNYYSIKETVPRREIIVMYRKGQYLSQAVLDLKQLIHELLG